MFVLFTCCVVLPITGLLAWNAVSRKGGTGLLMLVGLLVMFLGERWFAEGTARVAMSGFGLLVVVGAVALRAYAWNHSTGGRREGHKWGLVWSVVALASLLLYALALPGTTEVMGLSEEAAARWSGAWYALFPIVTLLGVLPTLRVDQILAAHPVVMPAGAARSAQISGVIGALAISLMFPVNYLADQHEVEKDVAHFRTTRAGESTLAMVGTLTDPVEAILFYPPGNDVGSELDPYFRELAEASAGHFTVKRVDQAVDPVLAEELKVRDNGEIVLRQGESTEKFRIDTDLGKAKRDLRQLDGEMQKHLIKLTRGQRTAYFLSGHGEANWRDKEEDGRFRKIALYKKEILEAQNFRVKTLSVVEGSTTAVPDDADLVVVAAPRTPLYPEEVDVLEKYYDQGGALLIMVDATADPVDGANPIAPLLHRLGVTAGEARLANAQAYAPLPGDGPPSAYVMIVTDKFGSHPAVKTLSRNSQVFPMVLPDVVSVEKEADAKDKVTTLVRSLPNTWADSNGNFAADEGEAKKVYELAVAVSHPVEGAPAESEGPKEGRAIVVGTQAFIADLPLYGVRGNAQFSYDATRWLIGDDEVTGEIENEEDVKIQHTRDEDWLWFLTAEVGVPALVLAFGVMFIRLRRKK
ncbi:MAG: Gldg family protein [Bryobacterales bacterium]